MGKKKKIGIVLFAWEAVKFKKNLNFKIDKDWFGWHGIITYTLRETGDARASQTPGSPHKGDRGGGGGGGEDVNLDYSAAISLLLWKRYGESLLFH